MSKKNEKAGTGFESVENALSRTEQYIEENQKSLTIIVIAIIVVVGGYLGYKKFYLEPKNIEAQSSMYIAEQYFDKDSFKLALNGDGQNYGFLEVIDEYGVTSTANLAHYYAGVCYLKLGQFEDAIEQLKKFDAEDILVATEALGNIGDCYSELGDYEKAGAFYMKAASRKKNNFITPIYLFKAGQVFEFEKQYEKALKAYQLLEKNYPESDEGKDIHKYITALKIKMK